MAMEINSYTEYATAVGHVVYTGRINKSTGICSVCHQARNNTERTQCFIQNMVLVDVSKKMFVLNVKRKLHPVIIT